jgi:hypothetical protein
MGERPRGPPGPRNAKRCPAGKKQGSAVSQNQSSVNSATLALDDGRRQEKSFNSPYSVTELERLRAVNARRARLEAELLRVYGGGARVTLELFLLFAELLGAEGLLLELAPRFGGFDQSFLRDRIGHEFPPPPVHLISEGRR